MKNGWLTNWQWLDAALMRSIQSSCRNGLRYRLHLTAALTAIVCGVDDITLEMMK